MARKPNFTRKKKRKQHGEAFWDAEYKNPTHLKLSTTQSEDLEKFTRWVIRRKREDVLSPAASVLDVGCGNGRNLIFLNQTFGNKGVGYDISKAAIAQAAAASRKMPIKYTARSIAGVLDVADNSQSLVLDMMTSHFLNKEDRLILRDEIFRTLEPGGLHRRCRLRSTSRFGSSPSTTAPARTPRSTESARSPPAPPPARTPATAATTADASPARRSASRSTREQCAGSAQWTWHCRAAPGAAATPYSAHR